MLRSLSQLMGYVLDASSEGIGRCKDFLVDDQQWVVRYMVADTGRWLPDRKVLISPVSLGEPDWASHRFPVLISKEDLEEASTLDEDEPVSRQHEEQLFEHYGYAAYWGGGRLWGVGSIPGRLRSEKPTDSVRAVAEDPRNQGDSHLRSVNEVMGYRIQATDGEIGHVEDFIVDDERWIIRYVVVDTRNWLPGRKVLVAPDWFTALDWAEGTAKLDLTRAEVEESPGYDPAQPINRVYETRLYDFYGRPAYW